MQKSIHYFTLASYNNFSHAQYYLGLIYYLGLYVPRNINKAFLYFSLAANKNHPESLFFLGSIYLSSIYHLNSNKGIYYLTISAEKRCKSANFALGYLYLEGTHIKKNIKQSIHHFKEASSFNDQYSKNNLGIIYKYGFENEISPNISLSIEYFTEAIRQKNNHISKYNLSHIYLYNDQVENINKSIELLLSLYEKDLWPVKYLLCLAIVKKYGCNLEKIKQKLEKPKYQKISKKIFETINYEMLFNENVFKEKYEYYRSMDFLYDNFFNSIQSKLIIKKTDQILIKNYTSTNINSEFYEGFGIDL